MSQPTAPTRRSKGVAHIHPCARTSKKLRKVSDAAFRLWVDGNAWCAEKLSDGRISTQAVKDVLKPKPGLVDELVAAELWHRATDFNGYRVHDYLEWSPSKAEVEAAERPALAVVLPPVELTPSATARAAQRQAENVYTFRSTNDHAAIGHCWFFHASGRMVDFDSFKESLAFIGRQPESDRTAALKHWQETSYITEEGAQWFYPDHAKKFWDEFVRGPRRSKAKPLASTRAKQAGMPSSRSELESIPLPKWIPEAK